MRGGLNNFAIRTDFKIENLQPKKKYKEEKTADL